MYGAVLALCTLAATPTEAQVAKALFPAWDASARRVSSRSEPAGLADQPFLVRLDVKPWRFTEQDAGVAVRVLTDYQSRKNAAFTQGEDTAEGRAEPPSVTTYRWDGARYSAGD